jgi:hypothetical protein
MNVILKPAGLLVVLGAFGVMGYLAISRKAKPEVVVIPESVPLASPAAGATPKAAPQASEGGGKELSDRPQTKINWRGAKHILEPDITGPNWHQLITKGKLESSVVASSVPGHKFAKQLRISELGVNPWDLQLAHPLDVAFKKGSHVRLTYWGRSKDSCTVAAVVEEANEPYTKIASRNMTLTPEWKQYSEEWDPKADTEPGWAHIDFQVGYKLGEIELTGVILEEVL